MIHALNKSLRLVITVLIATTFSITAAAQPEPISITEARNLAVGDTATIQGVVTTPDYRDGGTTFFVQDETAGINIFNSNERSTEVTEGDSILVTGVLDVFNGLVEIIPQDVESDIIIIKNGSDLPEPQTITYQQFIDAGDPNTDIDQLQGSLVMVENITTDTTSWPADDSSVNLTASDVEGNEYAIRVWSGTDAASYIPQSGYFNLTGILGSFNAAQLYPFSESDFEYVEDPAGLEIPEPPYAIGDTINYNGSFVNTDLGATEAEGWLIEGITGSSWEIVDDAADGDNRALMFNVALEGENWYESQAVNEPINVVEGDRYRASVHMKADTTGRLARFYVGMDDRGGWERVRGWDTPQLELTTDWTEYTFEFDATAAHETNQLRLAMEFNVDVNDGGIIYIDNAQMVKVTRDPENAGNDWSFEGTDFGGFEVLDEAEYNTGGIGELSTEKAHEGSQSIKMTSMSGRSYTDLRNTVSLDTLEAGGKLTYHIWISEEDLSSVRYIQPFVQHGEAWQQWSSIFYQPYAITPGAWNTIEMTIPEAMDGIYQAFGIQMTGYHAKNEGQPVMYVDNVIYQSPGEHNDNPFIVANEADSLALVDFYNATNGSEWNNNTNWLETPVHYWQGVAIDSEGRVTGLNLPNNNLAGELPESFSGLTKVNWLEFSNNTALSGPIFEMIAGYDNMIDLYADNCAFNGSIPQEIGNHSNFYLMIANQNQISGTLPDSIGNLIHLDQMTFWNNEIEGSIPETLGNLTSLRSLDFGNNNLTGEIPEEFFQLTNLEHILLYGNSLQADVSSFMNFTKLRNLALSGNEFSGVIPASIGNLSELEQLNIDNNQISGSLPAEIGNLQNLRVIVAWGNQFEGGIPSEIGNLSALQVLNIGNEGLGGVIPASIGQLENLTYLRLNSADLTGTIPAELGNLTNLQSLYLYDNNLSGEIPVELSNMTNLSLLYLFRNQDLSGTLPAELGQLENLQRLSIDNTGISGIIPSEWGNLHNLNFLRLENTNLEGMLPASFTTLENLNTFYISDTQVIIPTDNQTKLWAEGIDDFESSNIADLPDPELSMPQNGETSLPVPTLLSWNGDANADFYTIELYADEALEDTVHIIEMNTDSWVSLDFLVHNTMFYWRAAAGVSYGSGGWSEVFSFKTQLDTEAGPELLSPVIEEDSVSIPVNFSWAEVAGAQNYYLEVSLTPSFDTTSTVKTIDSTRFVMQDAIDDTSYFWRVRAVADNTPGGWSAVGAFATELRAPETPSWGPENGAEDVPVETMLVWNKANRAETYNLQLADSSDFENPIINETGLDSTKYAVSLEGETTYYWRIQAVNSSGSSEWSQVASFTTEVTTSSETEQEIPDDFALQQNYPNPFNPSTVISYQLAENSRVELEVFDMVGRKVATLVSERKSAGNYTVTFDAGRFSSGMYIYRLRAGDFMETRKMMLIK